MLDLLIPLTMIIWGNYFMKKAPAQINSVFGYRTPMSMKNQDTWEFAHKYCGKIWYICGWILLVVTIPAMLPVMKADEDTVGSVGTVLCLLQIIPLILSIVPTELALRKNFDKNGRRRRRF